ncbi:metallophosphoesterase [Clostridioides difficile]|uniref:metallophosphoesterase n=1 Tax=Clostridioides difficile TaxID=1496 RepID=UPI000D1DB930|nr:metallophosphoesterase [Clostridioides difficile]MBZ4494429.1 metallophosphoesterase [Clostridioides difficile]MCL0943227.1 metallophosphoesterase [Clostridioides difficile]MCM4101001.1 metallophosphoesterase [Clostridioides difficile]MDI2845772.1 metallophosphoesterase [Clostridioides difficile]HBG2116854.1 metallophosphoesterase [Clostridioides difficile]
MEDILKKKEDESLVDYRIRIRLAKVNKEIDLDWGEIVELLGLECSPDHCRKVSYGLKEAFDYLNSKIQDNSTQEEIDKINEKILELKKIKVQLSDERSLVNKKIREYSRIDNIIDLFNNKIDDISLHKPFLSDSSYKDYETSNQEAVMLISDIHYGLETINAFNRYNSEIFKIRIQCLKDKVIEYSKLHKVKRLHVMLLGDLISGHIHNSIRLENRENIVEQIIEVSEILSEFIYELSKEIDKIIVYSVGGNHDRVLPKKDENLDKDNFTLLIDEYIKLRIKSLGNVIFQENIYDNDIIVAKICGNTCFGTHGDKDKMSTAIPKLTSLIKLIPDYIFMAHLHNCKEDSYGESEIIVNGSFSGTDTYAKNLRLSSYAMQKLIIFNDDGRLCTYNIKLK